MSGGAPATFSLKRAEQTLGLSRAVLTGLIRSGFVAPVRGARNEHRFSFQDLVLLRTAHALQQARIPPARIVKALASLRSSLPAELPLTGLRISAIGSQVVVRDRLGPWEADSRQWVLDFDVAVDAGEVAFMPAAEPPQAASPNAADQGPRDWFRVGELTEATDPAGAEAAYRRAIALDPALVDAYLNLGAMLCEAQRCDEAVQLFEHALAKGVSDPVLHFNHAIALEDRHDAAAALASYERALALDPGLADAHYNAGRLLEQRGDARGALRHFNAYRRLQPRETP